MAELEHAQAEELLGHVAYELVVSLHAAGELPNAQGLSRIVFLESHLIHLRSLTDFFLRDRQRKTDLHRLDFAPEWPEEARPTEAAAHLLEVHPKIHKTLAHLTHDRLELAGTEWRYRDLAQEITVVAQAWYDYVRAQDCPHKAVVEQWFSIALFVAWDRLRALGMAL